MERENTTQLERASYPARRSLRKFKRTEEYRRMLRAFIANLPEKERRASSATEKCRLRLAKRDAESELAQLQKGETLSEFEGLLHLPDALREDI
jgi:hypothetical protein